MEDCLKKREFENGPHVKKRSGDGVRVGSCRPWGGEVWFHEGPAAIGVTHNQSLWEREKRLTSKKRSILWERVVGLRKDGCDVNALGKCSAKADGRKESSNMEG